MFHNPFHSLKYNCFPPFRQLAKGCSLHAYDLWPNAQSLLTYNLHVLYAEGKYDEAANAFIRKNLSQVIRIFDRWDIEFIYTPAIQQYLINTKGTEYYAPYADASQFSPTDSSWVFNHTPHADGKNDIGPTLLFNIRHEKNAFIGISLDRFHELNDKQRLNLLEMWAFRISHFDLASHPELHRRVKALNHYAGRTEERQSSTSFDDEVGSSSSNRIKYSYRRGATPPPEDADDQFSSESRILMKEILERIQKLRQSGISREALISMVQQSMDEEPLSRLRIDSGYRIWLSEYRNVEVKMSPLVKAVYLLFLSHPEGIVFKCLPDYRDELDHIYRDIIGTPALTAVQKESIERLTDPMDNSINEKCARIREAFYSIVDTHLADHYVVNGKRGEAKRISLDRKLVFWD